MSDSPGDRSLHERLARAFLEATDDLGIRRWSLEVARASGEFASVPAPSEIAASASFVDIGFDSMRAVDFKDVLEAATGLSLRSSLLFDQPTPGALASWLLAQRDARRAQTPSEEDLDRGPARNVHEPIAVIGIACRLPGGVTDAATFWRLLEEGRDATGEVPRGRWPEDFDPALVRRGGFLEGDLAAFDAPHFGLSPREAAQIDPQQRLLLEVATEALENAAVAADDLAGQSVGVFIGTHASEYFDSQTERSPDDASAYHATGNAISTAAGRLAYTFGFTGPCFSLDTACSASLVAVHQAIRSLRSGECGVALAGGVNLLIDPLTSLSLGKARMLAPDGRCKAFSAEADGYGRAEGAGLLLLKPLDAARRDGNRVLALLAGSAINQDGRSGGLTVPHGPSQVALIRAALQDARVSPAEVDFIEAHGTGTVLGDPIEIHALAEVFAGARDPAFPLAVGSVKTNLGHLETAAGAAGLIKLVLALEHGLLPRHLHVRTPSPHIAWTSLPLELAREPRPWPRSARRRIAGISSFGFSGTNAHVIVTEAPSGEPADARPVRRVEFLPLAASSRAALKATASALARHLEKAPAPALSDVAATLALGRSRNAHRSAVVASGLDEAIRELDAVARDSTSPSRRNVAATPPVTAFLFTGQGSQWPSMGREFYETEPAFRRAFDLADRALAPHLPLPIKEIVFADADPRLNETQFTQPAIFAIQCALAALWSASGIRPSIVLGHSIGDYAAAVVAGMLDLEDAARVIAARGRLMADFCERGAMMAARGTPDAVRPHLRGLEAEASIAAVNGPANTVVSGSQRAMAWLATALEGAGIPAVPLKVSHGFHSPLMDPMLAAFEDVVRRITLRRPRLRFISCLHGGTAEDEVATPRWWVRHVRETVRFADGWSALLREGAGAVVEIGPKPVLAALAAAIGIPEEVTVVASLAPPRPAASSYASALAALFQHGVVLDGEGLRKDVRGRRIALPSTPFQRERHWLPPKTASRRTLPANAHPLLGTRLEVSLLDPAALLFSSTLTKDTPPWIADHAAYGRVILPAAGFLDMALSAARVAGVATPALDGFTLHAPLLLDDATISVETQLDPPVAQVRAFRILSRATSASLGTPWILHASGRIVAGASQPATNQHSDDAGEVVASEELYAILSRAHLDYGPLFRGVRSLRRSSLTVVAKLQLDSRLAPAPHAIHPALLDAAFQTSAAILARDVPGDPWLPLGVDHIEVDPKDATALTSHLSFRARPGAGSRAVTLDLELVDASGHSVARVRGLQLVQAPRAAILKPADLLDGAAFRIRWAPAPGPAVDRNSRTTGAWLVAGTGGLARTLVAAALARGVPVRHLDSSTPAERASFPSTLEQAVRDGSVEGVVLVFDPAEKATAVDAICTVTATIAGLQHAPGRSPPRLHLVTAGARAVQGAFESADPDQAAVQGLVPTLVLEHPELRPRGIDLDPGSTIPDLGQVLDEIFQASEEPLVAFRSGLRFVPRLERLRPAATEAVAEETTAATVLRIREYGSIENLSLVRLPRRAPEPGEVEVALDAAALNFKDVLHVLGLLRNFSERQGIKRSSELPLGFEGAGRIVRVGPGITDLAAGDPVAVLAPGSLATHVTTSRAAVTRLPAGLSTFEVAALQSVFITAVHALEDRAQLKAGEVVLVHAAAGGVGLAAIQVARRLGAEVIASASPPKHAFLRSLGIRHIVSSRDPAFANAIRSATRDGGVDVVLNSLTGEFLTKSLDLVKPGGRFIEIGKVAALSYEDAHALRPDVEYHLFDLADDLAADPILGARLRATVFTRLAEGALSSLPRTIFPLDRIKDAFRTLAGARAVGKIVIAMPDSRAFAATNIRPDRSYLVTGGLGALGLRAARWLVEQGARDVTLLGRHEPGEDARRLMTDLASTGARVVFHATDITNRPSLARVLEVLRTAGPPLGGILHAAGVLDDGLASMLTRESIDRVLAPKLDGARHLDALTRDDPVEFFIAFGSVASVFGSAGQAAYAGANAALEAFAERRRFEGRPATTIAFGPWDGEGMAARLDARHRARIEDAGFVMMSAETGVAGLSAALRRPDPVFVVASLDVERHLRSLAGPHPPLFNELAVVPEPKSDAPLDLRRLVLESAPGDREAVLTSHLSASLASVLGFPRGTVFDPDRKLIDLGIDSLMAVDLKNRVEKNLELRLPATLVFEHPTLEALATHLLLLLGPPPDSAAAEVPPAPHSSTPASEGELVLKAEREANAPIAIIGASCRLPGGAATPEEFFEFLVRGGDAVSEIPADRFDHRLYFDPDPDAPGRMSTIRGHFIADAGAFDAGFFSISPREAAFMDPQHRWLLEAAWHALEDAGLAPDRLKGRSVGVFIGISAVDWSSYQASRVALADIPAPSGTGSAHSAAAGRIAYALGFEGPCLAVDTACSSALTALHLAVQSLRRGDCELAIAGGVNLLLSPLLHIIFSKARMLAPDGRCKAFAAAADGYGRGEGVSLFVLERASTARSTGQHVRAEVIGSAMNQDGATASLTVPSGKAQEKVIREALRSAGISPGDVGVLEAHGTGTALGDPIEMGAIAAVFNPERVRGRPLLVSSVKTNVGHLEAAAGGAALLKAVLQLERGTVVPHLHFDAPSPHIRWDTLAVRVPVRAEAFVESANGRIAGVSSFGFTGTNVHVVLRAAAPLPALVTAAPDTLPLLVISARSRAALDRLARSWIAHCRSTPPEAWPELLAAAARERSHLRHRLAVVARSPSEGAAQLERFVARENAVGIRYGEADARRPGPFALLPGPEPGLVAELATATSLGIAAQVASLPRTLVGGAQVLGSLPSLGARLVISLGPVPSRLFAELGLGPEDPRVLVLSPGSPASRAEAVAALHLLGVSIEFDLLFQGLSRIHGPLPLYPFERTRHWPPVLPESATEAAAPAPSEQRTGTGGRAALDAPGAFPMEVFGAWIDETLASVLRLPPTHFAPDTLLAELGLDSLGLIEIRRRLHADFELVAPASRMLLLTTVQDAVDALVVTWQESRDGEAPAGLPGSFEDDRG